MNNKPFSQKITVFFQNDHCSVLKPFSGNNSDASYSPYTPSYKNITKAQKITPNTFLSTHYIAKSEKEKILRNIEVPMFLRL